MYGYIYLTTNQVNNKKYIGQHRSEKFDNSYIGSGVRFLKAVKKYGKANFKLEVLKVCETEQELNDQEVYYIALNNAVDDEMFYNISYGGYKRGLKGLISMYNPITDKVIYCSEKTSSLMLTKGFHKGSRPRSSLSKKKLSETRKKMLCMTNDKQTIYCFPKEVESYQKQGYRLGRIPTRPNIKDEKRKWINKDDKSFMIPEANLSEYLQKGYILGRCKFEHYNRIAPAHNKGKRLIIDDEGKSRYI